MLKSKAVRIGAPLLLAAGLVLSMALVFVRGGWDFARPEIVRPPPNLDQLPLSTLTVTLAYDATELLDELEQAVPLRMGSLTQRLPHPTIPGLLYAFMAERDPFVVEMSGDSVRIETVIRYGGQAWYAAPFGLQFTTSCGVSPAGAGELRTAVAFASPLEIAEDWSLSSRLHLARIEPVTPADRCVISLLDAEMDVTDELLAAAEEWFGGQASRIDSVFATSSATEQLEQYWELIGQPIPLGGDAWLVLGAEGLRFADLRASEMEPGRFRAEIEIAARPRISFGIQPEFEVGHLPPHGENPVGGGPGIFVEGRVEYDAITEIVRAELQDVELTALGRSVWIEQLRIESAGEGRVAVGLELTGTLRGRIEMVGTPVFDPESNEIHVPDLTFTVPSGNLLLRSAAWVLRTGFPNRIRELARWPVEEALTQGRVLANRGLNLRFSDEVRIEGTMGAMEVVEVLASDDGLVVWGRVEATTQILIAQEQ